MERYFIYAILLYAFVVVIYLVWEHRQKKKLNAGRKKGFTPFRSAPKEDIIGKSRFTLRHSRTEATTPENSEKSVENQPIFADENGQANAGKETAEVRQSDAGTSATEPETTEDNSGDMEIDIVIDNEPEGEFDSDDEDDVDTWESEAPEDETASSRATGIGFDELAGMARTVENAADATAGEREEAGRILAEVRQTGIIGQIAPDEKRKKVVSSLMDEYFAAYHRREDADPEPAVKAPAGFSVRGFV